MRPQRLGRECLAEFAGTFLLVFFGAGAVFVSVLTGALQGLFQVAIIWGLVVALSIYAVGAISGAHINPAVTFAAALFRGFPPIKILPFVVSQLAGAKCASVVLLALFGATAEAYAKVSVSQAMVALAAGWGSVAIPGPRGGCVLVYMLAPLVGGCVGGVLYDVAFRAPASESLPAGGEASAARTGT